jgi:hypothetical protein
MLENSSSLAYSGEYRNEKPWFEFNSNADENFIRKYFCEFLASYFAKNKLRIAH